MATDQEMLDRIAKLSSAIEQQKSLRGRGGYSVPRGMSRGRGYGAPSFRGRGGHMSLHNKHVPSNTYYSVNNNHNIRPYTRPPPPPVPVSTHNRTLVLNGSSTPTYRPPPPSLTAPSSQHRTLIINHKGNSTTSNSIVKSVDAVTGRKQVAIDGVDFVVKGKKLIRKDLFDSNTTKSSFMAASNTAPKVLVRRTLKSPKRRDKNQNMVLGKIPTRPLKRKRITPRSKGGNMVFTREPEGYVRQGRSGKSLVLNTQRRALKKSRYCGFFTRYGKCPNANRCPFQHDPNRRAICPRFLHNRCKKGPTLCKLSHIPNANNMPHCVHFQKGLCKNDPCIYIHVRVSSDAPVCKAFAMEGFCSKGLECQEKHVHVCPEFAETGKCSNANCRLPHVAKRTTEKNNVNSTKTTGIIRLGSWVSPQYFHAQKMAKAEKRKAIEEAAASKVWTRPVEEATKEEVREKEEQDGFVRLFDDSDEDDGWSQFERDDSTDDIKSLRFNDEEEEEDEEDEEEEEEDEMEEDGEEEEGDDDIEEDSSDDSDVEEVYEEVSDDNMSDEE